MSELIGWLMIVLLFGAIIGFILFVAGIRHGLLVVLATIFGVAWITLAVHLVGG